MDALHVEEADTPKKKLTPAAERALKEAAERRTKRDAQITQRPKEINGRDGPEAIRYGDWEKDGIISDF
ncbi:MAG: DUF1674 domain-containing protein [Hyphomicrobiales bacterium]